MKLKQILPIVLSCFVILNAKATLNENSTTASESQIKAAENFNLANCTSIPLPSNGKSLCGWQLVDGNTLRFNGMIEFGKSFKQFNQLYKRGKTTTIVVNSFGGASYDSIEIAKIIDRDNIRLVIDGYCISACANYFLVAAKNIDLHGVIAFHGAAADRYWINKSDLDRINPLHQIGFLIAKKNESEFFEGREKFREFIVQKVIKKNEKFMLYAVRKDEIEKVLMRNINGGIDVLGLCVLQKASGINAQIEEVTSENFDFLTLCADYSVQFNKRR